MDLEVIKSDYKKMPTKKLVKLVSKVKFLEPNVVSLLQDELIKRGEIVKAIHVNDYLISKEYQLNTTTIFKSIVKLRKKGFSEVEIDKQLREKHEIDSNYLQVLKYSLERRGKDQILYASLGAIILLIVGVFFSIIKLFYITPIILLILMYALWHISLGLVKIKVNN